MTVEHWLDKTWGQDRQSFTVKELATRGCPALSL